ncbi:F-box/LRR-repeat protein 15-like isoform X2 [Ptychodera flava]|uniref:F-box/LRR-repeat protein 15-like isoform X2 n=1 Tax=Ptychodera flava TaxID=63121 RepID=UPI00396A9456
MDHTEMDGVGVSQGGQEITESLRESRISEKPASKERSFVNLLDLPWDDILISHILPYLSLTQLFQLQRVSRDFHELIQEFLASQTVFDFSVVSSKLTKEAFLMAVEHTNLLRELSLRNCKGWLKDDILIPVISRNQQLQKIDLGGCSGLTSKIIQCIAANCQSLQSISLSECHWVQAPSIEMLALNCSQLEHVNLMSCWELDDETILTLIMTHPGLKYLSLAKIYGITDVVIDMLARSCSQLEFLSVQGCWRITNSVVRLLGDYCPKLNQLEVEDCRDINEGSLARLRVKGIKIDVPAQKTYRRPITQDAQVL